VDVGVGNRGSTPLTYEPLIGLVVQEVLEEEMSETLGADKGKEPKGEWDIVAMCTTKVSIKEVGSYFQRLE
jgi:hypothetical protein